jgi:hypothetical protein
MGAAALPNWNFIFAASSAVAGQLVRAQNAMARLLHHNTPLRISNLKDFYPFRRPKILPNWQRLAQSRVAGAVTAAHCASRQQR